jgi:protein-L-isoaspartate(D-aspartate) O-methyltransferase
MEPDEERYLEERHEALMDTLRLSSASARVRDAFRQIPRHLFVPEAQRRRAYEDRALPLIEDQTISQPSMIAIMLEALRPEANDRALEIGAGSGYAAAVLSRLVKEVHAVEIRPQLAAMARAALARTGIDNVFIYEGDGSLGLPEQAPFDRVLVSAGARRIPEALLAQLVPGGRIAIPVGAEEGQVLRTGRRGKNAPTVEWEKSVPCIFVPLVEGTPRNARQN